MEEKTDRTITEAKINARAWKDPAFKHKLLTDPKAALKDLGMTNIPASVKIKVVEEEKNEWCLILHVPPANANELSTEDLINLSAAGKCYYVM